MATKTSGERGQKEAISRFAEEELRLREKTLSRTPSGDDRARKGFDPVLAPIKGGMASTSEEGVRRIQPPSGPNIDKEALAHRDRALQRTPSDTDPKKKNVEQITAPKKGGMR